MCIGCGESLLTWEKQSLMGLAAGAVRLWAWLCAMLAKPPIPFLSSSVIPQWFKILDFGKYFPKI